MADGDAHGLDDSIFLAQIMALKNHFQDFPTRQVRMTFTKDSSFRKVCFVLAGSSVIENLLHRLA
jgi:hypothetical protein